MNTVGNIVGIQAQEIAKVAEKYATMSTSEVEVSFCITYACCVCVCVYDEESQYFILNHFYEYRIIAQPIHRAL